MIKKYFLILVLTLFSFCMSVSAESANFEPFISMQPDITENQIRVALGFDGEDIMAIKETLTYDANKLTLVEVQALDNFIVTTSPEKVDGKYHTLDILVDSDYSFNESNYAILVFDVKNTFKKGNKTDLFLYNYTASGPEKIKFRSKGLISTLNRVSVSEMNFVLENITDSTKTKYWFLNHIYIFVIIGLIIVGAVVIILLLPSSRKKEAREKATSDLLKPENYDPNSAGVKIDKAAIDNIGKVEKPIDMTQAIIVDENVKPFGDIVGKFDDTVNEVKAEKTVSQVNAFDGSLSASEEIPKVTGEHVDTGTNINGFDPFNATIIKDTKENVNNISEEKTEVLETLEMPVQNNNDELTVINPQTFEDIEIPKLNSDVSDNVPKDDNNNNSNILSILLLLVIIPSLLTMNVLADDGMSYQVDALRDALVGRSEYNKSLDYNNDGTIDVLDIIETKDLSNCSFDNLLSTDPGFAELHGNSNNIISSDPSFVRPSSKGNIFGGRKTTKKKTEKTTRKDSGGGSSGFKTTGQRTTRETTERTQKSTSARQTTTKVVSVRQKYSVTINATNGSVYPNSFQLETGKTKSIALNANPGFVIDESASNCSNISYSFSSTSRLFLTNVTNNATCTLKFVPKGNVKVTLTYYIGHGNSEPNEPSYTYTSKSIDNGGNGVYNQTWQTGVPLPKGYKLKNSPTCGNYNAGTFSVTIPATSTTCKMYFDPILYNFKVSVSGQATQINGGTLARIFYGERKKVEFDAFTSYSTVNCTGGNNIRLSKSGESPYHYSFYYTHNTTSDAVCTIS